MHSDGAVIGQNKSMNSIKRTRDVSLAWLITLILATCRAALGADPLTAEQEKRLDFLISTTATLQDFLASSFREKAVPRLLRFSNGARIGYMDLTGRTIVPPVFDDAQFFIDGKVQISIDHKLGFIDTTGRVVISPKYEAISLVWVLPLLAKINGRWGALNEREDWVLKPVYEELRRAGDFYEVRMNGKWGVVDSYGRTVIEPSFDAIFFQSGEGNVSAAMTNGKWGLVDRSGRFVIAPAHDHITSFGNLALVIMMDKQGLIHSDGTVAISIDHDGVFPTSNRQRWIVKKGNVYGVVDQKGTQIIKQEHRSIGTNGERLFNISNGQFIALADMDGRFLTGFVFQRLDYFHEGLAAVQIDGKYGYIDESGNIVIPPKFDSRSSFAGELAVVSVDHKYGYIDRRGSFVIDPQFEKAYDFLPDGIAVVKSNGQYFYINKNLTKIAAWLQLDVPSVQNYEFTK